MTEEKIKESVGDNEFKIFTDEEVTVSYESLFDKKEVTLSQKTPYSTSFAEKLKEIQKQKEEKKRKLKKFGKWGLIIGVPAAVIAIAMYVKANLSYQNTCYTVDNKDEIMRDSNSITISDYDYGDSCTVGVQGLYADPEDPYIYGLVVANSWAPENIKSLKVEGYVYDWNKEDGPDDEDLKKVRADRNQEYTYEFDYEIHLDPDMIIPGEYMSYEIKRVSALTLQNIQKTVKPEGIAGDIYIYDNFFEENRITYYDAEFSNRQNDYELELVEFGIQETLIGFKFDQDIYASEKEINKKTNAALKMIKDSYLLVDGEKVEPRRNYRVTENEESGKYEYLIEYGTVIDSNDESVKLVIGDTKFKLK